MNTATKFFANIFVTLVCFTCLFTFFAATPLGNAIGFTGILGLVGQAFFNLNDNKTVRIISDIFMALPIGVCLFTILAFEIDSLVLGGIGVLGLIGLILLNKRK